MSSARSARSSCTNTSRTGPGRSPGWPPSHSPAASATRAVISARTPLDMAMEASPCASAELNAEEAAQGDAAPERGDRDAGEHEHPDQEREVDRVRRGQEREALGQRVDEGRLEDREQE